MRKERIYLAGRFSRKNELAEYASELENRYGHIVTSRWLTGAHDASSERELTDYDLGLFAVEDLDDIRDATMFVLFTESPDAGYTSGGRMVELGYALSAYDEIAIVIIGPNENVFTRLALERFDTWDEFIESKGWRNEQ